MRVDIKWLEIKAFQPYPTFGVIFTNTIFKHGVTIHQSSVFRWKEFREIRSVDKGNVAMGNLEMASDPGRKIPKISIMHD